MNPINRKILALSAPAVIATITTPLLGLMDTAFTSHMGGADYLAGIALGGNLFSIVYWLFGFLRMGTSGLTAQAVGAADEEKKWLALYRSVALAFGLGLIIIILQQPIEHLYRIATDPEPHAWAEAETYFRILVWGAPATLGAYALTGWFVGIQNSKSAMWISIIIDVVNIAVTSLFVIGLKMKVPGVASGTLIAQYTGLATGFIFVLRSGKPVRTTLKAILDSDELSRFIKVNRDIFLRTLCLIAVTLLFTRIGAEQGTVILAGNTILMQLTLLFSYVMDGVAYAGESLVGSEIGARNHRGLINTCKALMRWGVVTAIIFSAIYFACGEWILTLLSDDPSVREAASRYLPWIVAIPLAAFAGFVWDGVFIGATATQWMLASMAVSAVVFFAIAGLAHGGMGNHGLWMAFTCYLASRSITLSIAFSAGKCWKGR